MARRPLLVVAGVLERNGEVLVGQRRRSDTHPFKWEFPGGKMESGESPRDALRRELQEELGVDAQVGPELARYEFRYPSGKSVLLVFMRVTTWTGEESNLAFEQVQWVPRANLPEYDFLEGDVDFVRQLARGRFSAG